MKIFLTYDIEETDEDVHTDLMRRLIDHYGWSRTIKGDRAVHWLPATTLVKENVTTKRAAEEFKVACDDVDAYWEKFVVIPNDGGAVFNNQKSRKLKIKRPNKKP